MPNRFLLTSTVAAVLSACSGCATENTHTSWAPSPARDWLTRIERSDTAGPGVGYLADTVQISQPGVERPIDVFTMEELYGPGKITLRWRDPAHLQVSYAGGNVIFQAVKLQNITIEVAPLRP